MSGVAIFIMVMVVAMVIGPIMMLQPSRYQRNLAKLRSLAAHLGLRVRIEKLNDETIASYERPWALAESEKKQILPWRLDKKPYAHDIHIAEFWQLSGELAITDPLRATLTELVLRLSEGVLAVEITSMGARCFWNELGGEPALNAIAAWLGDPAVLLISKRDRKTPESGLPNS
jgi:hypothetical protein